MAKKETEDTEIQTQASPQIDPNAPLPQMSMAQLLAVIQTAQTQQQTPYNVEMLSQMGKTIAEAILESRKPMPDPKAEAHRKNEEHFKAQERLQIKQTKDNQRRGQDACKHLSGTKGDLPDIYGRTAIAWHMNDVGIEFGICLNCTRVFTPLDPDYTEWKTKPSFCRIHSAAGQRTVFNHQEALDKSVLRDS